MIRRSLIILFWFQAGLAVAETPTDPGKISQRIRNEIMAKLPDYCVQPVPAAMEKTSLEVDPEVVVLTPFVVNERSHKAVSLAVPEEAQTTSSIPGTGVTEIKGRRVTTTVARILFIPIWFKLQW